MSVRMSSIQFLHNYRGALNRTYQQQQALFAQADGSKIHKGSDNPIAYSSLMRYKFTDNENYQYGENVKSAISWMKNSDSVIADMSENIKTFSAKTVQAANSYLSDTDAVSIGREMDAIIKEVMTTCNQQLGDRYLFAGQKDTSQPFIMSDETFNRGLAKTLDSHQAAFFKGTAGNVASELYQMLSLEDDAGNFYYLDTQTGYVYDKYFVDEGYKNAITDGYARTDAAFSDDETVGEHFSVAKMTDGFKVSDAFSSTGVIRSTVTDTTDALTYNTNADGTYSVTGINIFFKTESTGTDGEDTDEETDSDTETTGSFSSEATVLRFTTIEQHIVSYMGDANYISMVKLNGATDRNSDIVNLTGQDMFGCDIFDNADSGNDQSGSAMLNNMITVYEKVNSNDVHWLTSDGITMSDVTHATLSIAETSLGTRLQLYTSVQDMLDNQSTIITEDMTRLSGTDVAELATKLMELTTIYNLALSLGGRILPQSLADYL